MYLPGIGELQLIRSELHLIQGEWHGDIWLIGFRARTNATVRAADV